MSSISRGIIISTSLLLVMTTGNNMMQPVNAAPSSIDESPAKIERLDPALIRPGRVDRKIELGNATPDQAHRLFLWFFQGCGVGPEELESLAERFAARDPLFAARIYAAGGLTAKAVAGFRRSSLPTVATVTTLVLGLWWRVAVRIGG